MQQVAWHMNHGLFPVKSK